MNLLAGGISSENELTVIILCVSAVVLVLFDVVLLVSLHRRNRKLAKKRAEAECGEAAPQSVAPAADTSTPAAGRGSEQQNHNM